MKRAIVFLVAVAMVITAAGTAMAGSESGDKEIQIQGSLSKFTNSENDNDIDQPRLFNLPLIIFFHRIFQSVEPGGETIRSLNRKMVKEHEIHNFLLLRGDLYLGSATSKIVPYIGGHAGQSSYTYESADSDSSGSTSAYGWHGGLKIFATENTSWNLELNTTTYTPDAEDGQKEIDFTNTQFLVGFSYYF